MSKLAVLISVAILITAQLAYGDIVKRVVFPRDRNSATYSSRLPHEAGTYHAYVLSARKGQRLSVTLKTDDKNAAFAIYEIRKLGPEEDLIFAGPADGNEHSAVLPLTSEYSVQVYGVRDADDLPSRAPYSLLIKVTN